MEILVMCSVTETNPYSLNQDLKKFMVSSLLPIFPLILHYKSVTFCCWLYQPEEKKLISTPSFQQPSPPKSSLRPSPIPNRLRVPKPNILTCCLDKILHKLPNNTDKGQSLPADPLMVVPVRGLCCTQLLISGFRVISDSSMCMLNLIEMSQLVPK